MGKVFFVYFFLLLVCVSSVSAVCTLTLDKDVYFVGETALVTGSCSSSEERNRAYAITWYNGSDILQIDVGTTPGTVDLLFFESFTVNDSFSAGEVNLTGSNLEGSDTFTSVDAPNNTVIISDIDLTDDYLLGNVGCIHFDVSFNNESANDAKCYVDIHDVNDLPVDRGGDVVIYDGHGTECLILSAENFRENTDYLGQISCFIEDVDGERYGSTSNFEIMINSWLGVNTLIDKTSYSLSDEQMIICANITNFQDYRIPLRILYNFRCDGSDDDLDRIVVDSFEEIRGIDGNTTQNQCALLDIKNLKTMTNRVNVCYAATDVMVMPPGDGMIKVLMTYSTTSERFNITSDSSVVYDPDRDGENNMIAIVLAFILSICAFSVLGGLSLYLSRIKQIETAKVSFWVAFVSLGMSLIQLVLLLFLIYANQVQYEFSGLLLINFYVCMLVGFGAGLIIIFQIITEILAIKRIESGVNEGDKRFERRAF